MESRQLDAQQGNRRSGQDQNHWGGVIKYGNDDVDGEVQADKLFVLRNPMKMDIPMKKLLIQCAIAVAALASPLACAESPTHPGCALVLGEPVRTIHVEKEHTIDVCLPEGSAQIDRIVLGQAQQWQVVIGKTKDIAYITPLNADGATNALVYLKGEPEVRYELRLRAVKARPN